MAREEQGPNERLVRMRVVWGEIVMSDFGFVGVAVVMTRSKSLTV